MKGGELVDFSRMAQERPTIVIAKQPLPHAPEEKNAVCRQLAQTLLLYSEMTTCLDALCDALTNDVRSMFLNVAFKDGKTSNVCFYIKTGETVVGEAIPFTGGDVIPELGAEATPYLDMVLSLWKTPMAKPFPKLVRVVSEFIARLYEQPSGRSRVRTIHVRFDYDICVNPRECVMRVII